MRIQTRLDRLTERARALAPVPSLVLFVKNGEEMSGTFDDMIAQGGAFRRFLDNGSELQDVYRLLGLWDEAAKATEPEEPAERT